MRNRCWKDNTNVAAKEKRNVKRYGKRSNARYSSPFMLLDEQLFGKEEEE